MKHAMIPSGTACAETAEEEPRSWQAERDEEKEEVGCGSV
jgi:hypothetical protein